MVEGSANDWAETSAQELIEQFEQLVPSSSSFSEREVAAMALANALVRSFIERELGRIARGYDEEIFVDGRRFKRHTSGRLRYHTLCGSVAVQRDTYRLVGVHNGHTVVPLELEAGIIHNATPALAASVLQAFATMPSRHYAEEMQAAHRVVPSRTTCERIAKRVGKELHTQLPLIEPLIRENESIPKEAASVSVGLDRTTIPMAEQDPPLPERWQRKRKRRLPPPVVVAYRMAYVATVAINDKRGETIVSKRIAATANEGPIEMMERLGAELRHILATRGTLPVVVVQDGAPELWNLVEEWFENFEIPITMKLLDRYHLDERLAQVAEILERREPARRALLARWRSALDRGDAAIKRICKEIENCAFDVYTPDPEEEVEPGCPFASWPTVRVPRVGPFNAELIDVHLGYCRNNTTRMHYATARSRGFPIGSGVTEGACKSVIATRLKRSGQRWLEAGASVCLQMRTLHLNGRLPGCFEVLVEDRRAALH